MSGMRPDELDQVARACASIEIEDCTPPYLQDFIAGRLEGDFPDLSAKVRRLGPDEMDELCEYIKGGQPVHP
jgi:hypothetical protein